MIMMNWYQYLIEFYTHLGVHILPITEPERQADEIDGGFRKRMSEHFTPLRIGRLLDETVAPGTAYFYEDDFGMSYAILRLRDEEAERLNCRILSMGPVLLRQPGQREFQQLMQQKAIAPAYQADYLEYFNQTPLISSELWHTALPFLFEKICAPPLTFRRVSFSDQNWAFLSAPGANYTAPSQPDVALTAIESRYEAENKLLHAVSTGNTDVAMKCFNEFMRHRIAPRTSSQLRDHKNLMITFNTLLRKSVEKSGVHPLHIDNLSRQFAVQIESAMTFEQTNGLEYTMIHKYCLLVKNYARQQYSSLVQTCLDTIDFYYNTELSLSYLAKACSVSDSHLSTLFKKETGMTVTDYINQTRIHEALALLNTTSLSIGEVASRCGFFDANYFTRVFKKLQGTTPKQYRCSIQAEKAEGSA